MTLIANPKTKGVKTPTHILLNSDIKENSMQILKSQGLSLSAFLESKLEELIIQSKNNPVKKPMKKIKTASIENTLPLTSAKQINDYDSHLIPETDPNEETSIQLSFSHRLRNGWL